MSLQEVSFTVVDTETTGTRPGFNRVIEIGAVKVAGGKIVDEYRQLINPGVAIPYQITRLTGITNSMVYAEPPAEEVLDEYLAFLDDDVFVAHNVRFDQRFLNAELRRAGKPIMKNKSLCTARLARRLLSGLRSKGLTSLAKFYSIRIANRHRAFDDAEATAKILIRLLDKIRIQIPDPSLADVLSLQMKPYKSARPQPEHIKRIKLDILIDLPSKPGVYFMYDASGEIIYVGKAKNLKSRVRSYFNAIEAHPPKTRELTRAVRDVKWKETGNELSALLQESKLIKEIQPRFNRALKKYGRKPFIKLDTNGPYPAVSVEYQLIDDGAEYYGPVRGSRYARFIVDLINQTYRLRECDDVTLAEGRACMYHQIGRCLAPCSHAVNSEYLAEVDRVRRFLCGTDETVLDRLRMKMNDAAEHLHFEEARRYRDWITKLESLFAKQRKIASNVMDHNAVIVLPGDGARSLQLFFVRYGRLESAIDIDLLNNDSSRSILENVTTTVFESPKLPPKRYRKEDVEEVRILASWMYVNRNSADSIKWTGSGEKSRFVDTIMNRVCSMVELDDHGPGETERINNSEAR